MFSCFDVFSLKHGKDKESFKANANIFNFFLMT